MANLQDYEGMIAYGSVANQLNTELIRAATLRARSMMWGDRFDGTPNFDHAEGATMALRNVGEKLRVELLTDEQVFSVASYWLRVGTTPGTPEAEDVERYIVARGDIEYLG